MNGAEQDKHFTIYFKLEKFNHSSNEIETIRLITPNDFPYHSTLKSPRLILLSEWKWVLLGAIISFLLASILLSGWPNGLIPNTSHPYTYEGDGLSHSWMIQRVIEGWLYDNPRSGYPFGSNFLDYPGSDTGNLVIIKLIGLFTKDYHIVLNTFILASFILTFIASYTVFRSLKVPITLTISGSILYNFLPFHFLRIGHLFYLSYFVVPIYFFISFYLSTYIRKISLNWISLKSLVRDFFILMILSSFGVYYTLFGMITIGTSGLYGLIKFKNYNNLILSFLYISFLVIGVGSNSLPNIIHNYYTEPNQEVAIRKSSESEIYGLKLIQLILPRSDHRINVVGNITSSYNKTYPLINENHTATLGIVGSTGFIFTLILIISQCSRRKIDQRLSLITLLVVFLFLFGTIGGLGAIFSAIISSSIRGWNRISIFIAFGSLVTFFLIYHKLTYSIYSTKNSRIINTISSFLLLALGLFDQTVPANSAYNKKTMSSFHLDREFIRNIEKLLPENSAIYQLPYMPFPEHPPLHQLHTYDLAAGFLHSHSLRWNYGGMKGREGDLFFRSLSREPIEKQVEVIKQLGFSGIYIDRRGYKDNGQSLIAQLSQIFNGPPILSRKDGKIVFFKLQPSAPIDLQGMNCYQILKLAGFSPNNFCDKHPDTLLDGINFAHHRYPSFIKKIEGLSDQEPWGRWSDSLLSPSVHIEFKKNLPTRFTLVFSCQTFGPNSNDKLSIVIGSKTYYIKLKNGFLEYKINIDIKEKDVKSIQFVPPKPTSPQEIGLSDDTRKLGLGFVYLKLVEQH